MGTEVIDNILTVMSIVSGVLIFALGLVVLKGSTDWSHRWPFAVLSISSGLWSILIGLFYMVDSAYLANIFVPLYYIFALYIGYGLLYFCLSYTKLTPTSKLVNTAIFLPVVAMSVIIIIPNIFIKKIILLPERNVLLDTNLYILFTAIFCIFAVSSLALMSSKYISKSFRYRKLMVTIFAISLAGGAFFNLLLPYFGIYSGHAIGPLFILLIVGTFFYLVLQRGLFDIKLTLARSVAYLLSLLTVIVIYSFLWYLIYTLILQGVTSIESRNFLLNIIGLTILTSIFFQPVRNFFDKITFKIFYKGTYTVEEFLTNLSNALTSSQDLRTLFARASIVISKTLKSSQVFISVWYGDEKSKFTSGGTLGHTIVPKDDLRLLEQTISDKPLVQVSEMMIDNKIRRLMISHGIDIAIPLKINDETFGFLFIGEKQLSSYSKRDIETLMTGMNELVIAIQNTISTQRIKELNENLYQKINTATYELRSSNKQLQKLDSAKDEFLSMASHQLRTPLTSVKGYLSMVLEGDVGEVTSKQRRLLSEAFVSSERMVHLINDFLSVSRLQTGKFIIETHVVDVEKMVRQEINSLKSIASARGLKLKFKPPKDSLPKLLIDEAKMRQVVMNYVDNALFYSADNSTIDISLSRNRNNLIFKVKDTGIGVPRAEKSQLFSKFYRASNARKRRPDGTGVGLYLAKKIIDAHQGKILFESSEGKGSMFGFSLPIDKLLVKDKSKDFKNNNN